MPESPPQSGIAIRAERGISPLDQQRANALLARSRQRPYVCARPPHPGWISFAAQRHVRAIAAAPDGSIWAATWGGLLHWDPAEREVWRHGSEHGLAGGPVRRLAVDQTGVIWAGQEAGLCSLSGAGAAWRQHPDLAGQRILALTPSLHGGVVVAARPPGGPAALYDLAGPSQPARPIAPTAGWPDIAALAFVGPGQLLVGNDWALTRLTPGMPPAVFDLSDGPGGQRGDRVRICALAGSPDGRAWAATNWGLFCLADDQPRPLLRDEPLLDLAYDPAVGTVWALLPEALMAIDGDSAQAVARFAAGQFECLGLAAPGRPPLLGGAAGLYELSDGSLARALEPLPVDQTLGAVRCLAALGDLLLAGTTAGLCAWDGAAWQALEAPGLRDLRALVVGPEQQLWAVARRGGLALFEQAVFLGDDGPGGPLVAACAGGAALWAAAPDAIYRRDPGRRSWARLPFDPGEAAIQQLYHDGARLWVGTSSGLLSLPGEHSAAPPPLDTADIQALAAAPAGGLLAGTPEGLFRVADGHRLAHADVRALVVAPDGTIWAGASDGLHQISETGARRFTPADSGLPGAPVSALATQQGADGIEIWAGTPAGVARLRPGEALAAVEGGPWTI